MTTKPLTIEVPLQIRAVKTTKHQISGLFVFVLIGAYAIFSLLLVLIGVQAYRTVVQDSDRNGQIRTTLSYVSNRIRSADGIVRVEQMGEDKKNVLVLEQNYEGERYQTRIYYMPDGFSEQDDEDGQSEKAPVSETSGALYEQLVSYDEAFDPDMGEQIVAIGTFDITQEGNTITLKLTTLEGEPHEMQLKLRTGAR